MRSLRTLFDDRTENTVKTTPRAVRFLLVSCALVSVGGTTVWPAIPPIEREALIALYESTNGANWVDNTGWLGAPGTECGWYGVTCDTREAHVIGINLILNSLSGPIPKEIGSLSRLTRIDLRRNQLRHPIPKEIGQLQTLEILLLSSNKLTGVIPPEIGQLQELEVLFLSQNLLSGSIPPTIGDLLRLSAIYLSMNHLIGTIPDTIGNLPALEYLELSTNRLTGAIPPAIGTLTNLRRLSLSNNRLSGSIPAVIGNLSRLTLLSLSSNRLSGPIPQEIGNLSNLRDLFLRSNRLSGEIPNSTKNLVNMTRGDFRFNGLYTTDVELKTFLDERIGPDWIYSQTLAPDNVTITAVSDHTVWMSWDRVTYDDPGGYEVLVSPVGSDSWTSARWTPDKDTTQFPVTDLEPGTSYDFTVTSFTEPHRRNQNWILSDPSEPVMATTAGLGCPQPTISITRSDEITLSLNDAFESYLWSTDETAPIIVVDPESPEWFWVTVTFDGGCEETASVLVLAKPEYEEQVEVE